MESGRNDSPTVDSIAYLESQGVPTDDEDDDDIHFCKKCKQVFKKLEAYLEHKVKHDKFKVAYNRAPGDRRMVLPTLKKKETTVKPDTAEDENLPVQMVKPRKRRKKKSPPVDVHLIAERNTYVCTTCDRKFSREASLKWHIQYDHNKREGDSEEEEEDEEEKRKGEEEVEEDIDDQDVNFKVKEPPVKRVQLSSGDDERPFKCDMCGVGFKEVAVLKTHMLTHSNVRQYKCTFENCPYAFKTKGSLVRHVRRHTGERPYGCESCGRSFAESGALTRHMRSRKPCTSKSDADLPRYGKKWTYIPNIPAVVSQDKDGQESFVSVVPGEMVMVVTEGENGEQIFTEAQVVSNNETVTSLGETAVMEEGEVGESEVGELVAASDLQTFTPTQCQVCREECQEVEALRAHLRLHLADFPFHCGFCHFTTEERHDLRNHLQSKHLQELKGVDPNVLLPPTEHRMKKETQHTSKDNTEAQRAVKQLLELPASGTAAAEDREVRETLSARAISRCPICNRVFRGSSYLKQHMKSHAGDRPHDCPVCQKRFVTKDALNKHLIVHSDERNFKCGVCHKLFKRIAHVREHLKIHSGERPFPCSVCDKSFKTNNALKVHVRTHSDCFPYECRMCHRHFREKGSMQRHMRTHTGERPYICVRCGRGFAEHGTLNRHLKAKVQCVTMHQYQQMERVVEGEQQEEGGVEVEVHHHHHQQGEEEEGGDSQAPPAAPDDLPTVLTEFSSVVTDTQQYIVADHLAEGDTQTTEYVVLHTDLSSEDMTNVEIVTEGDIDPHSILSTVAAGADGSGGSSFVVFNEAGNQLRIIDSSTGVTVATTLATAVGGDDDDGNAQQPQQSEEGGATTTTAGVVALEEGVGERVVVPDTITVLTDPSGHIILSHQDRADDHPGGGSSHHPHHHHTPGHIIVATSDLPPHHHHDTDAATVALQAAAATDVVAHSVTLETMGTADTVTLETTSSSSSSTTAAADVITLGTNSSNTSSGVALETMDTGDNSVTVVTTNTVDAVTVVETTNAADHAVTMETNAEAVVVAGREGGGRVVVEEEGQGSDMAAHTVSAQPGLSPWSVAPLPPDTPRP
ncbi:uncharacterized protein LOC143292132 [Babylonia areolata]|uniref:uncharacterized protein LOC143292132 n=1 Tax=Babylonia areolata TaxID=304850 RepID=UPI003FD3EFF9